MSGVVSLTAHQAQLLRFIAGYQDAHGGVSPTFAEMKRGIGRGGTSGLVRKLTGLEKRGWIRRRHGRQQAIEVLRPVSIPRAPDGAPLYAVTGPRS